MTTRPDKPEPNGNGNRRMTYNAIVSGIITVAILGSGFVVTLGINQATHDARITSQAERINHLSAEHVNTRGDVDELRKRLDKLEGR